MTSERKCAAIEALKATGDEPDLRYGMYILDKAGPFITLAEHERALAEARKMIEQAYREGCGEVGTIRCVYDPEKSWNNSKAKGSLP